VEEGGLRLAAAHRGEPESGVRAFPDLDAQWDLGDHTRAAALRAVDGQASAERGDPIGKTAQSPTALRTEPSSGGVVSILTSEHDDARRVGVGPLRASPEADEAVACPLHRSSSCDPPRGEAGSGRLYAKVWSGGIRVGYLVE
jgi:hypothetical protein